MQPLTGQTEFNVSDAFGKGAGLTDRACTGQLH